MLANKYHLVRTRQFYIFNYYFFDIIIVFGNKIQITISNIIGILNSKIINKTRRKAPSIFMIFYTLNIIYLYIIKS